MSLNSLDQNINPQQSKPVRVHMSDTSRSVLMEQNTFRDTVSQDQGNFLQNLNTTSSQQEINDDMKFLSHSDLIDLNLNELNNLLTGNDQNFKPTEKEYFLEAFNLESNTDEPVPNYFNNETLNSFNNHRYQSAPESLDTKLQIEAQGRTVHLDLSKNQTYYIPRIDQLQDDSLLRSSSMLADSYCDVMPMMSSTIKSPEKNYLLIPVNEEIENSSMLQNCKSIDLNSEVLNKIDSASAGRSGVLLPLQMDTSIDSFPSNIKRKTPIRVVRSFTTNRIVTSKNKPETSSSTGTNETTNITVHQTINIYEDAMEYSISKNPQSSKIRKRKQTFDTVKCSDGSQFNNDTLSPAKKRPVKEQLTPSPLPIMQQLPTTSGSSHQHSLNDSGNLSSTIVNDDIMEKSPSTKVIPKKKVQRKKGTTEKCPKCNQSFKKLSVHIGKCSYDSSLIITKDATKKEPKDTVERFVCEICSKSFRNEKILNSHKLGHNRNRCKFCNKAHLSEKELHKHWETCENKTKKGYMKL